MRRAYDVLKDVTPPPDACVMDLIVDYKTFLTILNRPDGFKPAGTPGALPNRLVVEVPACADAVVQRSSSAVSRYLTRKETDSLVQESCVTCSHSLARR